MDNQLMIAVVFVLMSAGTVVLFYALERLWQIFRLRNVSISKIEAAPIGWTAISGLAQPRREINDPFFESPCLWWRCVVQGADSDSRSGWRDIKEMTSSEPFNLDDGTGKVMVAPMGAEPHVEDLAERIVKLTAENHAGFAPLLKTWGIKFTGFQVRPMRSLHISLLPTLRFKVQTLQSSAWISVTGHLSPGLEGSKDRLIMKKCRGEPFVISTRVPSKLPWSMEFKAAGRALAGISLIGFGGTLAWLLKAWGFWPSLAIMWPLSVVASISGIAVAWLLKRARGIKPTS